MFSDIKTDELEVDFIVLDDDVMSLEMPHFYQDFYQVNRLLFRVQSLLNNLLFSHRRADWREYGYDTPPPILSLHFISPAIFLHQLVNAAIFLYHSINSAIVVYPVVAYQGVRAHSHLTKHCEGVPEKRKAC